MATVTIKEAEQLEYQLIDKIDDYKRIIHNVIFGRDCYEPVPQSTVNVESAEKVEIDTSKGKPITMTELSKIHKRLDALYLEKNKIVVARAKFESTQTFTY